MSQILPSVSDCESLRFPTAGENDAASEEMNILLLRCSELSKEVARIRGLITQLAQRTDSHRSEGRSRKGRGPAGGSALHRSTAARNTSPVKSELARACRIALMDLD